MINLKINSEEIDLQEIYEAGKVKRWHTLRGPDPQTNADHSWGVALLILLQWPEEATVDLLKAALLHDLGERTTGDIPSPAKVDNSTLRLESKRSELQWFKKVGLELPEFTTREKTILAIADQQEAALHLDQTTALRDVSLAKGRLEDSIANMMGSMGEEA